MHAVFNMEEEEKEHRVEYQLLILEKQILVAESQRLKSDKTLSDRNTKCKDLLRKTKQWL